MRRIRLVVAVAAMMAMMIVLAAPAMAHERVFFDDRINGHRIEDIEIEPDGELDVEFVGGGGFETDIVGVSEFFFLGDEEVIILD